MPSLETSFFDRLKDRRTSAGLFLLTIQKQTLNV